jgi:type IV pilus assembly protein PilN
MLVDINLLPVKEKKSLTSEILIIAIVTVMLGSFTWIGIDYYVSTSTLQEKESILQQEKLLFQTEQKKQDQLNQVIDSAPLVEKIEYIHGKKIAAKDLLNHLVALLPERGYFMKYEYRDRTSIVIEAQFDTLADTTHYLHELTNSPFLAQASIENMETTNFEEVEEGKDMTAFENILPRYRGQYKVEFQKEKILELKGEENGEE